MMGTGKTKRNRMWGAYATALFIAVFVAYVVVGTFVVEKRCVCGVDPVSSLNTTNATAEVLLVAKVPIVAGVPIVAEVPIVAKGARVPIVMMPALKQFIEEYVAYHNRVTSDDAEALKAKYIVFDIPFAVSALNILHCITTRSTTQVTSRQHLHKHFLILFRRDGGID